MSTSPVILWGMSVNGTSSQTALYPLDLDSKTAVNSATAEYQPVFLSQFLKEVPHDHDNRSGYTLSVDHCAFEAHILNHLVILRSCLPQS